MSFFIYLTYISYLSAFPTQKGGTCFMWTEKNFYYFLCEWNYKKTEYNVYFEAIYRLKQTNKQTKLTCLIPWGFSGLHSSSCLMGMGCCESWNLFSSSPGCVDSLAAVLHTVTWATLCLGLTTPGSKQAKIFLVRPWQHAGRKMPTLLPNGWLIFSIFVYVDGSHVFLMVPSWAIDEAGPEPEQGTPIGLGLPGGP